MIMNLHLNVIPAWKSVVYNVHHIDSLILLRGSESW